MNRLWKRREGVTLFTTWLGCLLSNDELTWASYQNSRWPFEVLAS